MKLLKRSVLGSGICKSIGHEAGSLVLSEMPTDIVILRQRPMDLNIFTVRTQVPCFTVVVVSVNKDRYHYEISCWGFFLIVMDSFQSV